MAQKGRGGCGLFALLVEVAVLAAQLPRQVCLGASVRIAQLTPLLCQHPLAALMWFLFPILYANTMKEKKESIFLLALEA